MGAVRGPLAGFPVVPAFGLSAACRALGACARKLARVPSGRLAVRCLEAAPAVLAVPRGRDSGAPSSVFDGVLAAGSAAAVALRAAALRGLERCGRVWGRFASTPSLAPGSLGRPLLSLGALIGTSLLKRALQAERQVGRVSATTR